MGREIGSMLEIKVEKRVAGARSAGRVAAAATDGVVSPMSEPEQGASGEKPSSKEWSGFIGLEVDGARIERSKTPERPPSCNGGRCDLRA
jgi:hypothetical protein